MGYTSQMSILYEMLCGSGAILIILGVIIILLTPSEAPISVFMILAGIIIIFVGRRKAYSWREGVIGERVISRILSFLQNDPNDEYLIYNDVKFPNYRGNIDHIVIGRNKIFVIETKNYTGEYIVRGDKWYQIRNGEEREIYRNPGNQIKHAIVKFKEFLEEKGIGKRIWIEAIVVMVNGNAKVEKEPDGYTVLEPSELVKYIKEKRGTIDAKTLETITQIISEL